MCLLGLGLARFNSFSLLGFNGSSGALLQQRLMRSGTSPVDDQGFSDGEQHNGDLGNGEEAPDGGLFKEVGGDQTSHVGTSDEEDDTLEDHTFLFIEGKEGSEHQERVNGSTGDNVSGVSHGNGPSKMVVSSESAELFTSEPFSRETIEFPVIDIRQQPSSKKHTTTD